MVSRRSTGPLRKILPAVAVGLVALVGAGCSSGQVTQTDNMEPAVNGNKANVGEIALRDVLIAYPAQESYESGGAAPLTLTIVNTGGTNDELTSVSSPAAGSVELTGDKTLPARAALQVIVPEEPAESSSAEPTESSETSQSSESSQPSETPSSAPGSEESAPESAPESAATTTPEVTTSEQAPDVVGTLSIVLRDLTADLPMGKNVPITFIFAESGQVTVNVPIATPETARPEPAEGGEE